MPQIKLRNRAMMPYDVIAMIKGDEISNYATLGAFWPKAVPQKIAKTIFLYKIAQNAAKEAGGDYWVQRVVDNMFTEKWARFIWPMIGMTKESVTEETAPQVGILVAQLMSDPVTRNQLINKEQKAETVEREEKQAKRTLPIKIAAGALAAGAVIGLIKNAANKGAAAAEKVSDAAAPKIAESAAKELVATGSPVTGGIIDTLKTTAVEKVKEIAIEKAAEALAPETAAQASAQTGESVDVAAMEKELENMMRTDQGLAPKKQFGIVEIGAGIGIVAGVGRMLGLW